MAGSKGSESVRSLMYSGKNALLPPKIPFPSVSASYTEYISCGLMGSRRGQKLGEEKTHHQRTSSESHLVEELPFWLDDLLNEPESPARKCGHRRSSSDSYAYLDVANATNISLTLQKDFSYRNLASSTRKGSQEPDRSKNARDDAAFYADASFLKQRNQQRDSLVARRCWLPSTRDSVGGKNMGVSSYMCQEATAETHEPKRFSSEENSSNANPVTYEADNIKRAKQYVILFRLTGSCRQFAQRSRVRKLQYISELERNVQSLQAEGSKVSAELDFLNQRNLILSMENKALKHRLESIAQEKLIKQLEQEMLENEIGRLRALYQQQQQQTRKPSASLGRSASKDLDSQFSSLSLNTKDSNCRRDSVSVMGQFHF
ncbi:unnamed protein product [Thlaspi arvense]|uniref:BZIP domain-containing protein n=1 Tax=Thlaspi arvense TaxID=13288 RepID=A0AAU9RP40_THLAR|nr:unnamed protein product [Thlaspi arvense]